MAEDDEPAAGVGEAIGAFSFAVVLMNDDYEEEASACVRRVVDPRNEVMDFCFLGTSLGTSRLAPTAALAPDLKTGV